MVFAFVCGAKKRGFVVIARVLDRESPPHKKGLSGFLVLGRSSALMTVTCVAFLGAALKKKE